MNFLSHYYFEQESSPEFLFGLILPDLYPGFNQFLRKNIKASTATTKESKEIRAGIETHFLHDKLFHQSDFFLAQEADAKNNFQLHCLEQKRSRPFLIRHIYIEMLMDRVLLLKSNELGHRFFKKLNMLSQNTIEEFFKELNTTESVADFFAIFNRFLSSKFLLNYIDNVFFINALIRSYRRVVSYISFEESDLQLLQSFVERDSIALKPEIMRFFDSFEYK
jgi:hypothetical protein